MIFDPICQIGSICKFYQHFQKMYIFGRFSLLLYFCWPFHIKVRPQNINFHKTNISRSPFFASKLPFLFPIFIIYLFNFVVFRRTYVTLSRPTVKKIVFPRGPWLIFLTASRDLQDGGRGAFFLTAFPHYIYIYNTS